MIQPNSAYSQIWHFFDAHFWNAPLLLQKCTVSKSDKTRKVTWGSNWISEKKSIFWFLRVVELSKMKGKADFQTAVFQNWKRGLCLLGSTQNPKISRKWPLQSPPCPEQRPVVELSPKLKTWILLVGKHSKPNQNMKIIPKNHENNQIRSDS